MSIRAKLLSCFAAQMVVLLVPTLFATTRLDQLRALAVEGRSGQASAVTSLGRMQGALSELNRLTRSHVATAAPELGDAVEATLDSLRSEHDLLLASPYADVATPLEPVVRNVDELSQELIWDVRGGRMEEATRALERGITIFSTGEDAFAQVAASIDSIARRDFERATRAHESARRDALLSLAIAIALAIVFAAVTAHQLARPMRKLVRATARVADGDFTASDDPLLDRGDELGELSRSFDVMTRRLADLDRAKAEFVAVASHELKTPLNVIGAHAELLEDAVGEQLDETQRSMLAEIHEQALALTRLVSRLLDISRLAAGSYRIAPETVRVSDIVTHLTRMIETRVAAKGIDFHVGIADSAPESVVLDIDIVRDDVLGNLLWNAVRYTPAGGRIDVEVEGDLHSVAFTVHDTGPGVPEEHRPFIFDKHYTVERTRRLGSGLGLAIAKEMVELHGGLIRLDGTRSSTGASFTVVLPREPVALDIEVPSATWTRRPPRPSLTPACDSALP